MRNVFVTNAAISQALRVACAGLAKSEEGKSVEVSGLLLGRDLVGDLLVTSAISGTQVSSELGCQLDENFLASVAYKILANKTSERIVGMFHSHPGIGVFMSQQDVLTHRNFQKLYPGFLMMVIDPLRRVRYRFFRYDPEMDSPRTVSVQELG